MKAGSTLLHQKSDNVPFADGVRPTNPANWFSLVPYYTNAFKRPFLTYEYLTSRELTLIKVTAQYWPEDLERDTNFKSIGECEWSQDCNAELWLHASRTLGVDGILLTEGLQEIILTREAVESLVLSRDPYMA